jgi:hypothetical protein
MSESNRVAIYYIPEVTYGVTPVNSVWKTMRFTGESISTAPTTVISNEIRADAQVSDLVLTGEQMNGGINFELSAQTYDDLLEAALRGTWTSNVLKAGTVQRSFSLTKYFADLHVGVSPYPTAYINFQGMRVGKLDLSFQHGAIVTGAFTFAGNGASVSAHSAVGSGSITPATTTEIMSSAEFSTLKIDGVPATQYIQQITLSLENGLRPINALGYVAPINHAYGRSMLTGQITAYFNDFTFYNHLLNSTSFELDWLITSGGNSYNIKLPKLKLSSGTPMADATDRDVMPPYAFTALYNPSDVSQIIITRV